MKIKVYVPDIECESCVTLLKRKFDKQEGIQTAKFSMDSAEIQFEESKIKTEEILQTIKNAGYRASLQPFEKKNIKERKREFFEKKAKYELEHKVLKYSLYTFLILSLLEVLAYFTLLKNIPYFLEKYP